MHVKKYCSIAKLMYKYDKDTIPVSLTSIFKYRQNIHIKNTRAKWNFEIMKYKTTCMGKLYLIQGPKWWNSIPIAIKNENKIRTFMSKLKKIFNK